MVKYMLGAKVVMVYLDTMTVSRITLVQCVWLDSKRAQCGVSRAGAGTVLHWPTSTKCSFGVEIIVVS